MSRNRYFAQLGVAFLIFLVFNVVILQRSHRLPSRTHLLKLDHASRFETLFVGNSLIANGVNTDAFTQASGGRFGTPLNLGLNSSMSVEHLMLSRRALKKEPHIKLFVYGCFFSLLTDRADYSKGLTGHQTLSYVLEPNISSRYYTHNLTEESRFFIYSHVPYLMEQNTFWQKVEQFRRRLASLGVASEETNSMGRVNDFRNLVTSDRAKIKAAFEDIMAQDQGLSSQVGDLLKLARDHTERVVVVNMPVETGRTSACADLECLQSIHTRKSERFRRGIYRCL